MVVSVDFSYSKASNLIWRDVSELTELSEGESWRLPEACIPSSLAVYLNGQVLDRESGNGFEVLSETDWRLKKKVSGVGVRHRMFVSYLKG